MFYDEDAKRILELFREVEVQNDDHQVRSYSGRGMFGRSCVGVDTNDVFGFIADVLEIAQPGDVYSLSQVLRNSRQDSMGRSSIIYWPDLPYTEEGDEDEEGEDD